MSRKGPVNPERSFGVSVGAVLVLVAAFLVWRGRMTGAVWTGGIGAVLVVLGLVAPALLTWPSALWWKLTMALGYVNARVILTMAFLVVLTPIALLWRLLGRDPLGKRRELWPGWTTYPQRYADRSHFTRMY
jgi:hypothetical protein